MPKWDVKVTFEQDNLFKGGDKACLTEAVSRFRVKPTAFHFDRNWAIATYPVDAASDIEAHRLASVLFAELKSAIDDERVVVSDYEIESRTTSAKGELTTFCLDLADGRQITVRAERFWRKDGSYLFLAADETVASFPQADVRRERWLG